MNDHKTPVWQLPASLSSEQLAIWTYIRHFAVPSSMIARATAAREAGDWEAACAASLVDTDVDMAGVARRYGAEVAERVVDDLRHLAPDLVRWHLPRVDSRNMTLAPKLTCVLASYGDRASDGPFLLVRTPDSVFSPQRFTLTVGPLRRQVQSPNVVWWIGLRHLWDVRHSDELRQWCGGDADRAPYFEADGTPRPPTAVDMAASTGAARTEAVTAMLNENRVVAAFAAAGIELVLSNDGFAQSMLPLAAVMPTQWVASWRAMRRVSRQWLVRPFGWDFTILFGGDDPEAPRAVQVTRSSGEDVTRICEQAPLFPEAAWRRPYDLDLLTAGRITPEELHPLVYRALFPARRPDRSVGPPPPQPPAPVRIRCGKEWHHVSPEGPGGLRLLNHGDEETRRELSFAALSGKYTGCFRVKRVWDHGSFTNGDGTTATLPRGLQKQRYALFARLRHSDAEGVEAMLDAGFDPTVRDDNGRTILHHLWKVDHTRLLPRLLVAGLDITTRDFNGLTPLRYNARHHPSPALLRDLIDAGAADTPDGWDWVTPKVIREYERRDPELAAILRKNCRTPEAEDDETLPS